MPDFVTLNAEVLLGLLDWELRDPWFLTLLPLAFVIYWLATRSTSRVGYSSLRLFSGTGVSWKQRFAKLPALLMAISFVALVIALARPRTPQRETRVAREGIAMMMVVDLSSSMDARDLVRDNYRRNRLDVVKEVFETFVLGGDIEGGRVEGRSDDLVGLVTFAGYADSVCPLTLDHGNLVSLVRDLEIVEFRQEDGTAIGDGLGLAVERLRRSTAKSRVAILLTDGVNNSGVIEPEKAADLAAEYDVKVYCIGAGTNGSAPIPAVDMFGRTRLVNQPVKIDEDTLEKIAAKTGGRYFRATDLERLQGIYDEIDELERTEVTETRYLQYEEHFASFVVMGLGLISLASALAVSVFRKLP